MVRRGEGTSRFRIIRRADSGVRCSQARRSSIRVDRLPERVCRISIRRCPRRDRVMSVVDAVVRSGRDFVETGRERGSRRVDPVSMQHRRRSAPENFFLKGRSSPENSVFDDVTGYGRGECKRTIPSAHRDAIVAGLVTREWVRRSSVQTGLHRSQGRCGDRPSV